jgi:hypothetical protein
MTSLIRNAMLLCFSLVLTGAVAFGQGRGGGPGGGGPGGGPPGGGMGGPGGPGSGGGGARPTVGNSGSGSPNGNPSSGRADYPTGGGANGAARPGLQLGPPGRWWDDKSFAKSLGLSKDQQKKMDSVFDANKSSILESYKALQKEESRLQAMTREKKLDEARIFAGIDAVAQARAGLEKANAHMLLQIRQEMDMDQNARLEKYKEPAEE